MKKEHKYCKVPNYLKSRTVATSRHLQLNPAMCNPSAHTIP